MSTGRVHRATAAILASLTAVFGVAMAGPAAAQTVEPTDDPAASAVSWLAGRFVDGTHLETVFDGVAYPDYGLTADAVLAFDGADVAQDAAAAATGWLADPANVGAYAGDGTAESYAGPLAKLALVAAAQGEDAADFGGVDLLGRLTQRLAASGRFSDLSAFGDFSNGITQSLAVIALLRAGDDTPAGAGAGYLAGQQCDDGGFPLQFDQATCASQPDATGFAVQALLAAGLDDEAAAGLDHLQDVQQPDGGFQDAGVANANSTGLAGQALRVGGRDAAADAAAGFLAGLQVGCNGATDLLGAIRFDAAGTGDTQRATAQGIPGLTGVGLAEVDNSGDAAATPEVDCSTPTTTSSSTTTSPSSSTTSSSSTSSSTTTTTSAQAGPVPGGGSGNLPTTGVQPMPAVGIGALLVLAGVAVLLLARQRRAAGRELGGGGPA